MVVAADCGWCINRYWLFLHFLPKKWRIPECESSLASDFLFQVSTFCNWYIPSIEPKAHSWCRFYSNNETDSTIWPILYLFIGILYQNLPYLSLWLVTETTSPQWCPYQRGWRSIYKRWRHGWRRWRDCQPRRDQRRWQYVSGPRYYA